MNLHVLKSLRTGDNDDDYCYQKLREDDSSIDLNNNVVICKREENMTSEVS